MYGDFLMKLLLLIIATLLILPCVLPEASALPASESATVDIESLKETIAKMEDPNIAHLNILLSNGTITLDKDALSSVISSSAGEVTFSISKVDPTTLNTSQTAAAEGRPVYEVRIYSSEDIIDFGGSAIAVSLPYELRSSEAAAKVCIWYMNEEGKQEMIPASYENGFVNFETNHLSYFAVGYDDSAAAEKTLQYLLLTALLVVAAAILAAYFMHKKQSL